MNSKKRFEGRQLLLVVAIFGILLMHVTSDAEVTGAYTTAAITEESPGEAAGETTTSGTQEAPGTASVDIITSVKQDATEVSAGETRTSAESSVTEGTVDIITSVKQDATEVSAGETRTSAESSVTEGTVGYKAITSAVAYEATTSKGVPSDTESGSSTQEQSQSNEAKGPTTETGVTGHTVKLVFTTRRVTSEETTASMGLAKETTAENVTSTREKTAVDTTTVAPSHGYTKNCKKCEIPINGSSKVWKVNGSICESETDTDTANKYRLIFESHQRNSPEPSLWTRNISFKLNCVPYAKRLENAINSCRTTPPIQYRRKRQQPDETTSASHTIVVKCDVGIEEMPMMLEKALNACITNNDCVEAPPQVTTVLTESSTAAGAVASRAASTIGSIAAGTDSSSASGAGSVGDLNLKPPTKSGNPDIWEAHRGLFLTVLILISVCVIVTVVCCLCMAWRGREKHPDKQPISMEDAREAPTAVSNPIPDAEMICDEAPMQERENPAVTPNGGGQHISKPDEDNGWVVPLDELSKAEKEKPEVENTRL